jgi:hypothetical protein
LTKGFWQIELEENSREYFAMKTPLGVYVPTRLVQGGRNSSAAFQRIVDTRFEDFIQPDAVAPGEEFLSQYVDDSTISSEDATSSTDDDLRGLLQQDHAALLQRILRQPGEFRVHFLYSLLYLNRVRVAGFTISPAKAHLFARSLPLFGHKVGRGQIGISEQRAQALSAWTEPVKDGRVRISGVRAFIGALGYSRALIPRFSARTSELRSFLCEGTPLAWTAAARNEFEDLKNFIKSGPFIAPFHASRPTLVETDFSNKGLGGAIFQVVPLDKSSPPDFSPILDEDGFLKPCSLKNKGFRLEPVAYYSRATSVAESKFDPRTGECAAIVAISKRYRFLLLGIKFVCRTDHDSLCLMQQADANFRIGRWACIMAEFEYKVAYRSGKMNVVADALSRFPLQCEEHEIDPDVNIASLCDDPDAIWVSAQENGHMNCRGCSLCKIVKARYPPKSRSNPHAGETTRRNQLVHIDLFGPVPLSRRGNAHGALFCDECTDITEHTPLRRRAEASKSLDHWISTRGAPEVVAPDQAPELLGGDFAGKRKQANVGLAPSPAYYHHHNGKAEKSVGDVVRIARTLLAAAGLPDDLWDYAATHACYLKNTHSKSGLPCPEERWLKQDLQEMAPAARARKVYELRYRRIGTQPVPPFGARISAVKPHERRAKLQRFQPDHAVINGIFLGVIHREFMILENGGRITKAKHIVHTNCEAIIAASKRLATCR